MKAHFSALFSTARRTEDGVYSIELLGMLLADDSKRATLRAASSESYEAALRDLASRNADLLDVPLDDESGLFVRVCRQRTNRTNVFLPRDAPLTLADCARLDEVNQSLPQLRAALRPQLSWSSTGPAGFNAEVYAQFMLHRILALVDGAAAAWNGRNGLAAAILARAVLESVAVWVKVTKDADRHLSQRGYDDYDKLIARVFFGKKSEPAPSDLTPIHVLTAIDALDKDSPGVRRAYDELCEIAHPNGESLFAITDWQDVDAVSLDTAASNGDLFGKMLSAIRLDIALDYLGRWEKDLAPRLGRLWQEVHNQPPTNAG
jgi:hypothetical protein